MAHDPVDATVSIELDHFKAVYAFAQVDELAYLVTDIPPRYLQPADLFDFQVDGVVIDPDS